VTPASVSLLLSVALTLAGCRANPGATRESGDEGAASATRAQDRPYFEGTERMRAEVRSLLSRLPRASLSDRLDVGRRVVAIGEPAVPLLEESLASPDADVRSGSAWLLGLLRDPRSAPALRRAAADPVAHVACEAAASLLKMEDAAGYERLVQGLSDPDPRIRSRCVLLLERATGTDHDYRPDDAPEERAAAIARWRAWLDARARGGA
jgi:HEAT repeat protein